MGIIVEYCQVIERCRDCPNNKGDSASTECPLDVARKEMKANSGQRDPSDMYELANRLRLRPGYIRASGNLTFPEHTVTYRCPQTDILPGILALQISHE